MIYMEVKKEQTTPSQDRVLETCLVIYLVVVITMVISKASFSPVTPRCPPPLQSANRLPTSVDDFHALFSPSDTLKCEDLRQTNWKRKGQYTKEGMELPHFCYDFLAPVYNSSNCLVYSLDPSTDNVYWEFKMGADGCRVHIISNITLLNYSEVHKNTYMYPLHLSDAPGAFYDMDRYMELLSHQSRRIDIIKTSTNGSEWRLLSMLHSSKIEWWRNVKQIRLVINVPSLTSDSKGDLDHKYLMVHMLPDLGFELVFSKPLYMVGERGRQIDEGVTTVKRYETIWINKNLR